MSNFRNPAGFDPSSLDPKLLMELSQLIQQLPPAQVQKMQTLMHNAMAGFDVKSQMEEFEKNLPPGFREKMMSLMSNYPMNAFGVPGVNPGPKPDIEISREVSQATSKSETGPLDLRGARLTILRAVADGQMSPEDAEKLLFPE